jgi:carboxyl-terminal processing protease
VRVPRLLRRPGPARSLAAGAALLLILFGGFAGGVLVDQNFPEYVPVIGQQEGSFDQSSLNAVLRTVRAHYYEPGVDYSKLSAGSINGLVSSLGDPYTVYFTPKEYKQQQDLYASRHTGVIGVYVVFSGQRPAVSGVVPGSPAQKAGLMRGDVVLAIDGRDTSGLSSDAASAMIRGKAGTTVTLRVQRGGGVVTIGVHRENFTSPTVQSARLEGDVLYIRVYQFAQNTTDEFDAALRKGLPGAKGVVLDLRDNGGGYVSAARSVISRFVKSGEAFETRGRDGSEKTNVDGNHPAAEVPLTVLVNGNTASASEIVSGSLQAHHRGKLVGMKTFGKGSVQVDYPMPGGGDLHLTIQHWFLPDGRSINHSGLQPDVTVDLARPTDMFDAASQETGHASDTQLNRALEMLRG